MIVPTAHEELRCALYALENPIADAIRGTPIESAVATLGHVLRHVNQRIESEGQMLFDDIAALRKLLPGVRGNLQALSGEAGVREQIAAIDQALARSGREPDIYPSLALTATEAGALRECIHGALKVLQPLAAKWSDDADFAQARKSIREYMLWQIEQEATLIHAAFDGHGPRR